MEVADIIEEMDVVEEDAADSPKQVNRPDPFDEADIYGDPTESFSFADPDVVEPQEILVEVSEGGGCNSLPVAPGRAMLYAMVMMIASLLTSSAREK